MWSIWSRRRIRNEQSRQLLKNTENYWDSCEPADRKVRRWVIKAATNWWWETLRPFRASKATCSRGKQLSSNPPVHVTFVSPYHFHFSKHPRGYAQEVSHCLPLPKSLSLSLCHFHFSKHWWKYAQAGSFVFIPCRNHPYFQSWIFDHISPNIVIYSNCGVFVLHRTSHWKPMQQELFP